MPPEPEARVRVSAWAFAALHSVEPHIMHLIDLFNADLGSGAGNCLANQPPGNCLMIDFAM